MHTWSSLNEIQTKHAYYPVVKPKRWFKSPGYTTRRRKENCPQDYSRDPKNLTFGVKQPQKRYYLLAQELIQANTKIAIPTIIKKSRKTNYYSYSSNDFTTINSLK